MNIPSVTEVLDPGRFSGPMLAVLLAASLLGLWVLQRMARAMTRFIRGSAPH